ncbi:MAG: hydantoinase/oxoprolinase family protein [Hyphomicrobiaceae bacterium]|nr:hydantoinase/oxoprolinase family protein [Hyphomicrobiaceae bacterium]
MTRLAFDTGGTFTDFALIDDAGSVHLHKVLSTPADPAAAVAQGVRELLARPAVKAKSRQMTILGATTVVTNAVLERKGVKTAFLTSDGFQDMLRIRTEGRYDLYDLKIEYPEPLVPRNRCYGVRERVAADGRTVTPLDAASVDAIARACRDNNVASVAVCLLHAYKFPDHEHAVGALLAELLPGVSISLSSDVCPEIREYDRASTTVINSYTRPLMTKHVDRLESELKQQNIDSRLLWMTSSGGLVPSRVAATAPVRLIESGPAAGAVAAAEYARQAEVDSVMSFDMGGTTAKLCLVPNGEPMVGSDLEVARHQRFRRGSGFPLKIQSIQMVEIGAGGGSIAAKNKLGLLDVGPHSAGAAPGPACYGLGGEKPTVTDADVVLGYVGASSFLGGGFSLDVDKARAAIAVLADSLGVSIERCAWGIHDLVNGTMAEAATMHAADYGVDPSTLPIVAFGGAGPVHAYGVAKKLNAKTVICPAGAGVTSAVGLLIAPIAVDIAASLPKRLAGLDMVAVRAMFERMAQEGRQIVTDAGVAAKAISFSYSADLRYVGQGHELNVALPSLVLDGLAFSEALLKKFETDYAALFGRTVSNTPVEAITWRLRVSGPKAAVPTLGDGPKALGGERKEHRHVYFDTEQKMISTPVFSFAALASGRDIAGPAIIEQAESTIVVGPDANARRDARGNLIMTLA